MKNRIWYDTEFLDTGRAIHLISIGLVCEDGREYYAVNADAPWNAIAQHHWLPDNVVSQLPLAGPIGRAAFTGWASFQIDRKNSAVKPRQVIANETRDLILATPRPRLWANYSAHDHVALTQLWGPLTSAPQGIPWRTNDLQQEIERLEAAGLLDRASLPRQREGEHHALADARHNREVHLYLDRFDALAAWQHATLRLVERIVGDQTALDADATTQIRAALFTASPDFGHEADREADHG
ncbi:3'-5' exoribonuclease [Spongiactinospora sp. TRM90649]|uniref:3'-5' exoribonuclease domain-containing protein n=1 Tax=Spongiactinospora sp. TRM90649 TaxID=3031114 RepID=UPI0023F7F03E|nr:3'-5' exoribonuclease [Spongiactinospora sp. TRM90649]MDF5756614.1 3'-5' exoribonuclease [Spongiactinospora sp. TRM90649]